MKSQLLFRDPALCELVSALTGGRAAEVASRFNCRCKLRGELMRLRRFERRITWEDVLRDRGEVLYRSVCELLWLEEETREALSACWSDCC